MAYLTSHLLRHDMHVLTPGAVGSGKTLNANTILSSFLSDQHISLTMVFSAQTSSTQVLETIFAQLAKRKRGIFGPPSGKKLVVFIDDLSMPRKEQYGAQPPIEVLRELIDHQHWYVWKMNKERLKMEDLLVLGAMGPSGGGNQELSQRFLRQFNFLTVPELDHATVASIFTVILDILLKKTA